MSHPTLQQHFSSGDFELWSMTLTCKFDPDYVKMNYHTKYLLKSRVTLFESYPTNTDTKTQRTGRTTRNPSDWCTKLESLAALFARSYV